jgi:hypothetical protein
VPARVRRRPRAVVALVLAGVLSATGLAVSAGGPAAAADPAPQTVSTTATLEWGVNTVHQVPAANGACALFVAGIADGTEDQYAAESGDVVIFKRTADGQAIRADRDTRCVDVGGGESGQRALFTHGTAVTDPASGGTTISWTGAVTIYSYGGLAPWYVQDPVLTVDPTTATARVVAEVGGYHASHVPPFTKTPLAPETGVTVLELSDVSVVDGQVTGTPVYTGVDYFPLSDAADPGSARSADSAIPAEVKARDAEWGSWPESFVDFQYRTGLSSYWHSSGLAADPQKRPLAPVIRLAGAVPDYVDLDVITLDRQPADVEAVTGSTVRFEVVARSVRPLSYQWQIATGSQWDSELVWSDVPGATDATLTIPEAVAEPEDQAVRVVVSAGDRQVPSSAALFRVRDASAPQPAADPAQPVVLAGTEVTLDFPFTGYPTPTYRVERSDDGGAGWTTVSDWSAVNYVTRVLADSDDGARYRVLARNASGQVASAESTLRVLARPTTPTLMWDPGQHDGAPVVATSASTRLAVIATGFAPEVVSVPVTLAVVPAREWDARGATYAPQHALWSRTYTSMSGGTLTRAFSLPATAADLSEAYLLVAVAADPADRRLDAALPLTFDGQGVPVVVGQPADVTVRAGDPVELTVGVDARPAATVRWQVRLPDGGWQDVPGATGTTLRLTDPVASGAYRAVASNLLGESASRTVAVAVTAGPVVVPAAVSAHPRDVRAPVVPARGAAEAVFSVEVTGSPVPVVSWERRGDDGGWRTIAGATGGVLRLPYGADDDGAQVRARVVNEGGTAVSEAATLRVGVPASVLSGPGSATVVAGDGARLRADLAGDDLTAQWQRRAAGGSGWADVEGATDPTGLDLPFGELRSGDAYRVVASGSIPSMPGEATTVAVSAEATITLALPDAPAPDVADGDLDEGDRHGVSASAVADGLLSVQLPAGSAGQVFGVWFHSTPVWGGWVVADGAGRITVAVPDGLPEGTHRLIVVDAQGSLVGWTEIEVAGATVGAAAAAAAAPAALPRTGAELDLPVALALLLVGVGWAAIAGRRRARRWAVRVSDPSWRRVGPNL